MFAASNGLVALLAAVSTAVLARHLSTEAFGSFMFATSFLLFAALFFDFGLFLPAARIAATTEGRKQHEVLGAAILAYLPVGLAFCAAVFGLSFAVDSVFNVHAGSALLVVAPLAAAYPFQLVTQQLAQGADRLHVYSLTTALGQVLFMAFLLLAIAAGSVDVEEGLILRSVALLLAGTAAVTWLRPAFRGAQRHVRRLVQQASAWGFQVYVGRLLSIGTYNMDVLMLAAFTDATAVALYTLAGAIARGILLPVLGMSSALFPRMAREGRLERRWILIAWGVGGAGIALLAIFAEPFIRIVFSERYVDASTYVIPLAGAEVVRGVTTVYNSFLASQGRGKELRNTGLALTLSNLVFNFALIPPFGAMGAAIASLLALIINLGAHIVYYRRSLREPSEAPATLGAEPESRMPPP